MTPHEPNVAERRSATQAFYLAYCDAHGEPDPEAMLASDGGRILPFVLWMRGRWAAWDAQKLEGRWTGDRSAEETAAFTAWLRGCA